MVIRQFFHELVTVFSYGSLAGSKLLQAVLNGIPRLDPRCSRVFLHVQTRNEAAISFYSSFGFEITDTVMGCYKRIVPPNAYVLSKTLVRTPATIPTSPTRIRGRISSNLDDLTALHEVYPWLPSGASVRPPPDVVAIKHKRIAAIEAEWHSFADYIRATVFGLGESTAASADGGHRKRAAGDPTAVANVKLFAPTEFPYTGVPRHWVMWYGPRAAGYEVPEAEVTADIAAAVDGNPELAGKDFAWYINPNMTVPEFFHVQVFIEP